MLAGLLILAGLIGGGSRADIVSLVVLRPLAVIVCGFGAWTLTREHVRAHRALFVLAAALISLTVLHLVPLPPALWQALPGRSIVTDIDRAAGLGAVWRPLSMAPETTWNALLSLAVPLAVLIIGVQLPADERHGLLTVLIALGLLSATFALFQASSPWSRGLYFYRVTNVGLPVGLFANRNHGAVLMAFMLPMLAAWAASQEPGRFAPLRPWLAAGAVVVLLPLILVAGSRAGVLIAVVAMATVPFLFALRPADSVKPARPGWLDRLRTCRFAMIGLGAAAVAGFVAMAARGSRAVAVQRLVETGDGDSRLYLWSAVWRAILEYFPVGSGVGTFVEAFQVIEPQANLTTSYANHAHNDILEVVMTAGVPGVLLLIAAAGLWGVASWRAWCLRPFADDRARFARLGSVLILLLALASLGDYPLRVPTMMCLAVVAALWLSGPRLPASAHDGAAGELNSGRMRQNDGER